MAVNYLSSEIKLKNGVISIPAGCDMLVALVTGSLMPPVVNKIRMKYLAGVETQGLLPAISMHYLPIYMVYDYNFVMYGQRVVFVYLQNGVSCRAKVVSGYSAAGTLSGNLVSAAGEVVIGMAAGNNGPVTITMDGGAFDALLNETLEKAGVKTATGALPSVAAAAPEIAGGRWVEQAPVWVEKGEQVLVKEGYYEFLPVLHVKAYWYAYTSGGYDYYQIRVDGVNTGTYTAKPQGTSAPSSETWYTYDAVWHEPVYEEAKSGYWTYPPPVWEEDGEPAKLAAIFASVADVFVGSEHAPLVIVG